VRLLRSSESRLIHQFDRNAPIAQMWPRMVVRSACTPSTHPFVRVL
jgi:hypothetical protein